MLKVAHGCGGENPAVLHLLQSLLHSLQGCTAAVVPLHLHACNLNLRLVVHNCHTLQNRAAALHVPQQERCSPSMPLHSLAAAPAATP